MKPYEILESTSELKIRVFGKSLEHLFHNALMAMFDSINPIYDDKQPTTDHKIVLQATDRELLLIDFLSEALFFSDANNEAYYDVHFFKLTETDLDSTIIGKKIKGFSIEIKAVTHHDMHIFQKNDTLYTDILFDI